MTKQATQNPVTDNLGDLLDEPYSGMSPMPIQAANPVEISPEPIQPPAPAADHRPPFDPIARSRIESLKRKQRSDSFLASLTREQSDQIFDWFHQFEDLSRVHALVTSPPPEGLGLQVCHRTLQRLRSHFRALLATSLTEGILDTITDMEQEADLSHGPRIQNAMLHMLQEHAFDLARKFPDSQELRHTVTTIQKLSALEFQRQKLALERQRLLHQIHSPSSPRHHRVDLNIVPPVRDPSGVVPQVGPVSPSGPTNRHSIDSQLPSPSTPHPEFG